MALFGKKKKEERNEAAAPAAEPVKTAARTSRVLGTPRITEKATMHESAGVYTFNVADGANKRQIMQEVQALYKVTPRAVRVVTIKSKVKRNMRTGKYGVKHGGKKAYVYLKKGDTITLR